MSTTALTKDTFEDTVSKPGIKPGALPAAAFERLIQAVRDLDMDKVRAGLAQPQAEAAPR